MPQFEWITIRGFKSIRAIERLPLRQINILIGANGAGKSNFLGFANLIAETYQGRLDNYVLRNGGADKLVFRGSKVTSTIELESMMDTRHYLKYVVTNSDRLILESGIESAKWMQFDSREYQPALWPTFHFNDTGPSSPLKRVSDTNNAYQLRENGENLAAVLYGIQQQHPRIMRRIVSAIKKVAPYFHSFRLLPARDQEKKIELLWTQSDSDYIYDASAFSDGTIRFIALATILSLPEEIRPWVIQIDEPELGLHPMGIELVAGMIKSASVETQILISTQSAALVDYFTPQDILVAERINGETDIRRLDEFDLKSWLKDYTLGELWEKNIFGGRPRAEGSR